MEEEDFADCTAVTTFIIDDLSHVILPNLMSQDVLDQAKALKILYSSKLTKIIDEYKATIS